MSKLYEEALLEAKKLKELAEEEAKSQIINAMSPYIKKTINEEISGIGENFFVEEEDEILPTGMPGVQDPVGLANAGVGPMGDMAPEAPLAVDGSANVAVIDLNDLFTTDVAPAPPEGQPVAVAIEPPLASPAPEFEEDPELAEQGAIFEVFVNEMREVSEKVDHLYFSKAVPQIQKESVKGRLFSLLENLDRLKELGHINGKQVKLNENKLEFLFLKLKDAGMDNSYHKTDQKDIDKMTTLKEYAAQIWAEGIDPVNQPSTADDAHAAEQSGVSPEVGGPEDVKVAADSSEVVAEEMLPGVAGTVNEPPLPGTDPKPAPEKPWDESHPPLDEKDQDRVVTEALDSLEEEVEAEGHAGFGPNDTPEKPPVEFEVDEAELCEAIEALRLESANPLGDKPDAEPMEDAKPEGGVEPAQENMKDDEGGPKGNEPESSEGPLKEMSNPMLEDDDTDPVADLMGDEPVDGLPGEEAPLDGLDDLGGEEEGGGDADLVLHVELPDEVEDALASINPEDVHVDVDLGSVDLGAGEDLGAPMGDPGMPELPGEDPLAGAMPEEEPELPLDERGLYEAKIKKATRVLREYKVSQNKLKSELKEANLFIAKNVFFTKFLQRGDISRSNLKKIVEHLDRATTVKEAKSIYGKIKTKINESVKASQKLAGSSSSITTPGSATSLNENKQPKADGDTSVSRWQKLAGINKS